MSFWDDFCPRILFIQPCRQWRTNSYLPQAQLLSRINLLKLPQRPCKDSSFILCDSGSLLVLWLRGKLVFSLTVEMPSPILHTDTTDSFFHHCSLRFVTYQSHQESLILKSKSRPVNHFSFSTSSMAFSISNVEKDAHSVNMGAVLTHHWQSRLTL